ncbi:MAG: CBS domain-containing protein [Gaiellaceae bacterium]
MRGDTTRVLIAGGGVAALEAALALRALAGELLDVELLAPEPQFWYRPMSVAEPFGLGEAQHFDLSRLAEDAGARFTPGALVGVDAVRRHARTTSDTLEYDALLVASGAQPRAAVPGAVTFRGPADTQRIEQLLADIDRGEIQRLAFVVPSGAVWTLPAYELALMTAAHVARGPARDVEILLLTPEREPLALFGPAASEAVASLLADAVVELRTGVYVDAFAGGELVLGVDGSIQVDAAVALPQLRGARIGGIPQTVAGFIPVDSHARVIGLRDVYAAGDITSFPVKQGGIAAQQADVAATSIAISAGADVEEHAFRPVLRGVLLTGTSPRYLRREITGGFGETSVVDVEPLWWPPAKIVGRYLAPFLAAAAGVEAPPAPAAPAGALEVEIELEPNDITAVTAPREPVRGERLVDEVMTKDPLIVAPEDSLGEIAERLRERDAGSALVCAEGNLAGVLTSRDLLRAYAERVHPSEGRAREWMTAEPVTVPVGTSLEEAALVMSGHGFHHLPVVDEDGHPVGFVGLRDTVPSGVSPHLHIRLGL